ncbi:MAG: transcription antitermination factor NusB [Thermodesulfobacteriota bacterium]|nr:transcription antitermination factor NusB [Thermodesulfobacteriota bacterium]
MASRRRSRVLALQFLFAEDVIPGNRVDERLEDFCARFNLSRKTYPHFFTLVQGVKQARDEVEAWIEGSSEHWKISRMSGVDRNIMRIAVYEMLYCDDVPAKVAINEAIEIGKKFGTEESGAFINGVLDRINKALSSDTRQEPFETDNPTDSKE